MLRTKDLKQRATANRNRLPNPNGSRLWKRIRLHGGYYLIALPVLLFFLIFNYIPMYGVVIAFKEYNPRAGILESKWADPWFKYFKMAFDSPIFMRSVKNSFIIACQKIFFGFPFPIILALLIDQIRRPRYKKVVQTVSYLPYFISWVILSGILRNVLSQSTGALNALITGLGGKAVDFFGDSKVFRGTVFWTFLWKSIGYDTIIYLAAISGVDPQQIEAAKLDGASRFQIVMRIILPSIMPVLIIMMILNLRGILSAGFDQIFNMYSEIVYKTGDIIDTYTYRLAMNKQQFSYSTAVGLFQSVIGLILVLVTNAIARYVDKDSALV